ncbi:MAG: hypothetical protein M3Y34_05795, partial [Actinomycetota bacterium]|nr:hypothetical protein [Actinomycetota bacterium]
VPRRAPAAQRGSLAAAAVGTVSGIADSPIVLGLTRSRLWIGVLGSLLVGIVALNVMALSFNAASSETAALSDELREQNSALRADIADGLSNERLQSAAIRIGLVMPQAASALMLTPSSADAATATRRLRRGDFTIGSTYEPAVAALPEATAVDPAAALADPATAVPATDTALATDTATAPVAETTSTPAPVTPEAGGGVTP